MTNEKLILEVLHHLIWVTDELREPRRMSGETFNKLSKDLAEALRVISQHEEAEVEEKKEKKRKESVNIRYYGEKKKRIKVVNINNFQDYWKKKFKIGDKRTIMYISSDKVMTKEEAVWFDVDCFELVRPVK